MHEHNFKKTHRVGEWHPSDMHGILQAADEWIALCECGEQKKVRTKPRGIWKKAQEKNIDRFFTLPNKWQQVLRAVLQRRIGDGAKDMVLSAESVLRTSGLRWSEVEKWIIALVQTGIAEIFEPYPNNDPGQIKLHVRKQETAHLWEVFGLNEKETEKQRIRGLFEAWEYPLQEIGERASDIAAIIDQTKKKWTLTEKPEVIGRTGESLLMKSYSNYHLLFETLMEIFDIASRGEMVSYRDLAVRVSGHSKGLETLKPYIKTLLINPPDYGIIEHSPFLLCRLPAIGEIRGRKIDLSATEDYVSLTAATAKNVKIVSTTMKYLLLIENLTPFEKMARELSNINAHEVGVVFLSGYPPGHVKEFVKKLVAKPYGRVWCDLDPDGVEIALTVMKWFPDFRCQPIMMEPFYFLSSPTKHLEKQDIQKMAHLKSRLTGMLADLIDTIATKGVKVEQEAQDVPYRSILQNLLDTAN